MLVVISGVILVLGVALYTYLDDKYSSIPIPGLMYKCIHSPKLVVLVTSADYKTTRYADNKSEYNVPTRVFRKVFEPVEVMQ